MNNLIKFRVETFGAYGLNKYRNFLVAPECDCGCGSDDVSLMLKNRKDMFNFMADMLLEHGCLNGALFAIGYDDHMYAAIVNENAFMDEEEIEDGYEEELEDEEDPIIFLGFDGINMDFFAEIDSEFRCCCYGLIIETAPGKWKIIKD